MIQFYSWLNPGMLVTFWQYLGGKLGFFFPQKVGIFREKWWKLGLFEAFFSDVSYLFPIQTQPYWLINQSI